MLSKNKRLFGNAILLVLLQLVNYLAPLLLLPYLTRVLAVEEFGVVMAAMSAVAISYVITDYGFSLSATYKIARNRENKKYIDNLIAVVFTAKVILSIFAIFSIFFVSYIPAYNQYRYIFYFGIGAVVFQAFQPIWLFQGLEKMKAFAIYFGLTKVLHIIFVYLAVNETGDGYLVLASWSLANFLGCMVGVYFLKRDKYKIGFSGIGIAWKEIKKTASFFWSRLAIVVYTSASPIIIGNFSLQQAALYSTAEQGYKAGQAVTSAIGQALYPYMAKEKKWKIFIRLVFLVAVCISSGAAVVGYFAEFFVKIIFGLAYLESAIVLKIMMVTLVINCLTILFGYPALAAINKVEWANKTVMIGALFFVGLLILNILFFTVSAASLAIIILLTETLILGLRLYPLFLHKLSLKQLRSNENI